MKEEIDINLVDYKICVTSPWAFGYKENGDKCFLWNKKDNEVVFNMSQGEFLERRVEYFLNYVFPSFANQTNKNYAYAIGCNRYSLDNYKSILCKVKDAFESIGIEAFYYIDKFEKDSSKLDVEKYLFSTGKKNIFLLQPALDNDDIPPKNYINEIIKDAIYVNQHFFSSTYRYHIPIVLSGRLKSLIYNEGFLYTMRDIELSRDTVEDIIPERIPVPNFTIMYPPNWFDEIITLCNWEIRFHAMPYYTNIQPFAVTHNIFSTTKPYLSSQGTPLKRIKKITDKEVYDLYSLPFKE